MDLNYFNTFIAVAEDCPAVAGEAPTSRALGRTAAEVQYQMLVSQQYKFTQEDVLFESSTEGRTGAPRDGFFDKSRACLRASPMGKRYGWGIHFDAQGRAAAYGRETVEYRRFQQDTSLTQTRAMRSRRVK